MNRAIQLIVTLTAAIACAGCTALAIASKQAEIRRIEQEWGANTQKKIWIYQP